MLIADILANRTLTACFQPIVSLRDASITAHECLIRGPSDTALHMPDALFEAARQTGRTTDLEILAVQTGLHAWVEQHASGKLFVNMSAHALVEALQRFEPHDLVRQLRNLRIAPEALVIELTEHQRVRDMDALVVAADRIRSCGAQIALDDFGDGWSSLRLWAEVRPDIVKIDKYFTRDVCTRGEKVQMIEAVMRIAERFGTTLVAEGVETEAELKVLRDLGIGFGQGYFLGRPMPHVLQATDAAVHAVLRSNEITVLPDMMRTLPTGFRIERMLQKAPAVSPDTPHGTVSAMFMADDALHTIALVDGQIPVGLLNREKFFDRYAKPYFKELYDRRPCALFAHASPLILDKHTGIETLTTVLTSEDQRYLTEGFIITEGGRYLGIGTGEQLVRAVTEIRIEAARHANPLTFLPGNIPISQHIGRLLNSENDFVACYGDLNQFKPFNDYYGYWQGDEMIRLVANVFVSHCDARRDFIGHVGGDDFVALFQSEDWAERCERIIATFNQKAKTLFDDAAQARGGIEAEDRHGTPRFFGFTTLSIGAVRVRAGQFSHAEQIASAAAAAKHKAKVGGHGLFVDVLDSEDRAAAVSA